MKTECARGEHDWESGPRWGVIIGVSKCKRCGVVSKAADFAAPPRTPESGEQR